MERQGNDNDKFPPSFWEGYKIDTYYLYTETQRSRRLNTDMQIPMVRINVTDLDGNPKTMIAYAADFWEAGQIERDADQIRKDWDDIIRYD